jgi:hypothetical protein
MFGPDQENQAMRSTVAVIFGMLFLAAQALAQAPTSQPTSQPGARGRGPAPLVPANPNLPSIWIASDSTAANGARGWGIAHV